MEEKSNPQLVYHWIEEILDRMTLKFSDVFTLDIDAKDLSVLEGYIMVLNINYNHNEGT